MDKNSGGSAEASSLPTHDEKVETTDTKPATSIDGSQLLFQGLPPRFEKGSTTLGFVFKEGIMVAVDHSVDNYSTSSNSLPENVVVLHSHMLATISGGSEFLLRDLQRKCHEHELEVGERASAAEAAKWLADTLSFHSEEGLSVGILIAGWDGSEPSLYRVDGKGKVLKKSFGATGSGSSGVFGALCLEPRSNLTIKEAVFLAKKALCLATYRAPEKLEFVGVYRVGRDGWCTKVSDDDVGEFRTQLVATPSFVFPDPDGWSKARPRMM